MISTHLTIGLELHFIEEEAHTENKDQSFSQNKFSTSSLHYRGRGIFTWLAETWQRRGSVREQDQEAQSLTRLMGPLMTESELNDESENYHDNERESESVKIKKHNQRPGKWVH